MTAAPKCVAHHHLDIVVGDQIRFIARFADFAAIGDTALNHQAILGLDDPLFAKTLEERGADVVRGRPRKGTDFVFLGVHRPRDLARLDTLEPSLARDGAVWVVYPKGRKDPGEVDVIAAGKAAGFVDVKVARFSDTHTALKFVIPKARR